MSSPATKFHSTENQGAIDEAKSLIAKREADLATLQKQAAAAEEAFQRQSNGFGDKRSYYLLDNNREGLTKLRADLDEASNFRTEVADAVTEAEKQLHLARAALDAVLYADQRRRHAKRVKKYLQHWRELDARIAVICHDWRKLHEEALWIRANWPGGQPALYTGPLVTGTLLLHPDILEAYHEALYHHGAVEFRGSQFPKPAAPSIPGALQPDPRKQNPAVNRSLTQCADHAEAYLLGLLEPSS